MNDSTLPPSERLSNREDDQTETKVPINTKPAHGVRRKVPPSKGVQKGFALHDWMTLQRASRDLAQLKGAQIRPAINASEIQQHNDVHDAWISLRGKVYNITPYLHYHPGGVPILKGVLGKDATVLFDKYHRWVNLDGLIGCLLLGYLAPNIPHDDDEEKGTMLLNNPTISTAYSSNTQNANSSSARSLGSTSSDGCFEFAIPAPKAPTRDIPHLLRIETTESRLDDDKNPWEKNSAT